MIFDLDQTLVDRTATFQRFLEQQRLRFQNSLTGISRDLFVSTIQHYDANGYTPKREVYALACNEWGLELWHELHADFEEIYGQEPVLFSGVKEVLQTLKAHYKLGLITNGRSRSQNAKMENAGIREFFSAIKVSEEEGVKKPNPIIFERCLGQLGVAPSQAVYIGDHPENDVLAAQKVGLRAVWVQNARYPEPDGADGTVDNLSELLDLLETLPFKPTP